MWSTTTNNILRPRLASLLYPILCQRKTLKHERKGVLEIALERRKPACTDRAVDDTVIRAQRDLHDLCHFEATLLLRRGH